MKFCGVLKRVRICPTNNASVAFPREEDKDGTNQSSVFFVYFFCCSCNFVKLFTEVVLIKVLLHR